MRVVYHPPALDFSLLAGLLVPACVVDVPEGGPAEWKCWGIGVLLRSGDFDPHLVGWRFRIGL